MSSFAYTDDVANEIENQLQYFSQSLKDIKSFLINFTKEIRTIDSQLVCHVKRYVATLSVDERI